MAAPFASERPVIVEKATANRNSAASPRSLDMGDAAPPARAEAPSQGVEHAGLRLLQGYISHSEQQALVEGI